MSDDNQASSLDWVTVREDLKNYGFTNEQLERLIFTANTAARSMASYERISNKVNRNTDAIKSLKKAKRELTALQKDIGAIPLNQSFWGGYTERKERLSNLISDIDSMALDLELAGNHLGQVRLIDKNNKTKSLKKIHHYWVINSLKTEYMSITGREPALTVGTAKYNNMPDPWVYLVSLTLWVARGNKPDDANVKAFIYDNYR